MKVSAHLRALFERANGRCHYCNTEMTLRRGRDNSATKDHKIPRAGGGSSRRHNLVAACWACNHAKGTQPYDVFMDWVRRYGRPTDSPGRPQPQPKLRRTPEAVERERRIRESAAPWTRKAAPARTYVAEVGKYPTLRDVLEEAGLVPQSTISEVHQ